MRFIAFAVVAAGFLAAPALAQTRNPNLPAGETRTFLHAYGQCVVKREQALASRAITLNIDNQELLRRYESLIVGPCLPYKPGRASEARFRGDEYRYALADALVSREFASVPAPDLESVPMLVHRDPGAQPTGVSPRGKPLSKRAHEEHLRLHDEARAYAYLSRYGECVVRVDPAAARALLLTTPETPGEAARFGDLRKALGTCLAENQTINFGKPALRGTIAVNYYRLVSAALGKVPGATR